MKVKLLVKRDSCAAGSVVDYGPEMARELIAKREAEEFIPGSPPKKEPAPERAPKPVKQEAAEAAISVKEDV